jgi:DNA-binding CsgD family transcriptional regulator
MMIQEDSARDRDLTLNERERACLRLLAEGHSDEHIGQHLGIAARTVRFHIDKAKRALGANGRVHMMALALRANLLSFTMCVI